MGAATAAGSVGYALPAFPHPAHVSRSRPSLHPRTRRAEKAKSRRPSRPGTPHVGPPSRLPPPILYYPVKETRNQGVQAPRRELQLAAFAGPFSKHAARLTRLLHSSLAFMQASAQLGAHQSANADKLVLVKHVFFLHEHCKHIPYIRHIPFASVRMCTTVPYSGTVYAKSPLHRTVFSLARAR